jgi:hypothetical protein
MWRKNGRKKYGIDIICDGAFLFLLGSRFYRSDFPDWGEISATLKRIYLISDVTGRDGQVSDNGVSNVAAGAADASRAMLLTSCRNAALLTAIFAFL